MTAITPALRPTPDGGRSRRPAPPPGQEAHELAADRLHADLRRLLPASAVLAGGGLDQVQRRPVQHASGCGSPNFNLFENIKTVLTFQDGVFVRWALNTVIYAVVSAVGAAFLATAAGYAFAKYKFPGGTALVRHHPRRDHGPYRRADRPDLPAVRSGRADRHLLGGHPAVPGEPVRRVPDAGLRRRRGRRLADRGRPGRRRRRAPDLLHHRASAAAARLGDRVAVLAGGDLEQLLPAADHAQLRRTSSRLPVGLAQWQSTASRRFGIAGPVLHRDHRLAALDHPAGDRLPVPLSATGSPGWPPVASRPDARKDHSSHGLHLASRCCSAPLTTTSTSRHPGWRPTST